VETLAAAMAGASVALACEAFRCRLHPAVGARLRALTEDDLGSWAGARAGPPGSSALERIGRSRWAAGLGRERLLVRLEGAGSRAPVERVLGAKVALAAGALVVGLVAVALLPGIRPPLAPTVPLLALAAYRAPDFALAREGARRRAELERQVPSLAALLVVGAEAGLSPAASFRRAAAVLSPPLGEEARVAVRQMDLGTPMEEALRDLAGRAGVPTLARLVLVLARSQRAGAPLGPALRAQAEDLRAEQRTRAEELARRAPVKMLFPLVFLVLPAFLLLTVGPVLVATLRSLR
jgi:tight adherence protein C